MSSLWNKMRITKLIHLITEVTIKIMNGISSQKVAAIAKLENVKQITRMDKIKLIPRSGSLRWRNPRNPTKMQITWKICNKLSIAIFIYDAIGISLGITTIKYVDHTSRGIIAMELIINKPI